MKYFVLLLLSLASQIQAANWPLADIVSVRGTAKAASGVSGQSLTLDGASLIELKESAKLTSDVFTVSLWFNHWHFATLVVESDKASLFLNGKPVGKVKLQSPIAATQAPITLGGIWDRETVRQAFHGALDEFSYQPRAWSAKEIAGV